MNGSSRPSWSTTAPARAARSPPRLSPRHAPDGYTLEMATSTTHVTAAILNSKLPYDPVKDFVPVALIGLVPYVLTVSPQAAGEEPERTAGAGEGEAGDAELFLGRPRQPCASRHRIDVHHGGHQAQPRALPRPMVRPFSISPRAASTSASACSGPACRSCARARSTRSR